MSQTPKEQIKDMGVCVVGLGYVGLPLAGAFARHQNVTGYCRDQEAVDALKRTVQQIIPSAICTGAVRESAHWNGYIERFNMAPIS